MIPKNKTLHESLCCFDQITLYDETLFLFYEIPFVCSNYMAKVCHQTIKMGYTTEKHKTSWPNQMLVGSRSVDMLTWDIISICWDISSRIKLCGRQECATILISLQSS